MVCQYNTFLTDALYNNFLQWLPEEKGEKAIYYFNKSKLMFY